MAVAILKQGTPVGSLNYEDFKKIVLGGFIAMAGAGLTYLEELVPSINFGEYTMVAVALNSILVNFLRKLLTDTTIYKQ